MQNLEVEKLLSPCLSYPLFVTLPPRKLHLSSVMRARQLLEFIAITWQHFEQKTQKCICRLPTLCCCNYCIWQRIFTHLIWKVDHNDHHSLPSFLWNSPQKKESLSAKDSQTAFTIYWRWLLDVISSEKTYPCHFQLNIRLTVASWPDTRLQMNDNVAPSLQDVLMCDA